MPLSEPSAGGSALPEDGTVGDVLTLGEAGAAWGAPPETVFRGPWAQDQLVRQFDFQAGIPPELVPAIAGTGTPDVALSTNNAPAGTGLVNSAWLRLPNAHTSYYSQLTLNLAALGLVGVTRVGAWIKESDAHSYNDNIKFVIKRNGVDGSTVQDTPAAWVDVYSPADSDDTMIFKCYGNYGPNTGLSRASMGVYIAGIRVYANAKPYMFNEFVTYQGKMWRSLVDNNVGVPGTSGWAEALELPRASGTTAQRPDPVAAGAGYPYFDTTLVRPIWSSGAGWVDAGGLAV